MAQTDPELCPMHSGIEARLGEQESRLNRGETRMDRIEGTHVKAMEQINDHLFDIRNGLMKRPSWAVTIVITALVTLLGGLTVAFLSSL